MSRDDGAKTDEKEMLRACREANRKLLEDMRKAQEALRRIGEVMREYLDCESILHTSRQMMDEAVELERKLKGRYPGHRVHRDLIDALDREHSNKGGCE